MKRAMSTLISSVHNPHIKQVARLEKRSERERRRLLPVEGVREVSRALAAGHVPVEAYVCPQVATAPDANQALAELEALERDGRTRVFTVTPEVYARLAVREASGGVFLLLPYLQTELDALPLPDEPLLVVVENAEKPGNLGAILRTADAAGVDGLIACYGKGAAGGTDIHNPNTVRASLGTIFHVAIAEGSSAQVIAWLRQHGIRIAAATPEGASLYTEVDLSGPLAIVLGSEAHGLTREWLAAADQRIYIPMFGQADSLNLAASAAILLYEAVRQRLPAKNQPVRR
jgi:TrmH family RNA methyltransferase